MSQHRVRRRRCACPVRPAKEPDRPRLRAPSRGARAVGAGGGRDAGAAGVRAFDAPDGESRRDGSPAAEHRSPAAAAAAAPARRRRRHLPGRGRGTVLSARAPGRAARRGRGGAAGRSSVRSASGGPSRAAGSGRLAEAGDRADPHRGSSGPRRAGDPVGRRRHEPRSRGGPHDADDGAVERGRGGRPHGGTAGPDGVDPRALPASDAR